jgi:hypothetical protein
MLKMLASVVVSVVPQRYRRRWFGDDDLDVKRGAIISGVVQIVGCGLVLWLRYPPFLRQRQQMADAILRASGGGRPDSFREAMGTFSISYLTVFEYLLLPLTVFLIYLVTEGTVRLMAAVATNEVVPSLPLQILAWLHGLAEGRHREIKMGPRVVDVVTPGVAPDFDLMIESNRPKPWNQLTTIRYNEELFEVIREIGGQPPRRFVYLLRKMPGGKIVRGLHHYTPEETLEKS